MSLTSGIIKLAIEEAEKSKYKYRVGAVVFKNTRIISFGHNTIRSSNLNLKYTLIKNKEGQIYRGGLHAEQAAVLGLNWSDLKGCSIFVLRLNNNNQFKFSRPCIMCCTLLKYIKLKYVYYTTNDGLIINEKVRDL